MGKIVDCDLYNRCTRREIFNNKTQLDLFLTQLDNMYSYWYCKNLNFNDIVYMWAFDCIKMSECEIENLEWNLKNGEIDFVWNEYGGRELLHVLSSIKGSHE
ncbi:UNVERIFIED_CONTAM: hypothetical protein NCL1_21582 [Trichonephila clavipes]